VLERFLHYRGHIKTSNGGRAEKEADIFTANDGTRKDCQETGVRKETFKSHCKSFESSSGVTNTLEC
jgi:hypothetical protein